MVGAEDNESDQGGLWARILVPLTGFLALAWFLIRVVPKPSRAAYPCQRAAFPMASAFVLWVVAVFTSGYLLRRGRALLSHRRRAAAAVCLILAMTAGAVAWITQPSTPALAAAHPVNEPIGEAKGIHPGRVVWIHDPDATDWEGPGNGYWWTSEHTSQDAVEHMLSSAIEWLVGESDETAAWDALIRHFNITHGRGDTGYAPGEKIMIKVNLVGCHYLPGWGGTDPDTYDLTSYLDYMNTSPQVMLALLRRLVYEVGAAQLDITIGDPMALFPNDYHAMLAGEFPDVNYLDHQGGVPDHPRRAIQNSTVPLYWSNHPSGYAQDYILASYAEATYFVNLANFKSHSGSGVTLCAKNHYGSLIRYPVEDGFYGLHNNLAYRTTEEGRYRTLVDLMGHAHLGGKTLLYLIDGLYSGCHPYELQPQRWDAEPFGGDWTSSLFASQDPVAIESVCLDLMQIEGDPRLYPQMPAADDYLHEAAQANDPPSGTFYDPDHAGDVQRLSSLGVHEHWDDVVSMRYSRNLGSGDGIELVRLSTVTDAPVPTPRFALSNHPNPFNPRTTIRFSLPAEGHVELVIYDAGGAHVATLLRSHIDEGDHEVPWTGRNDQGREMPAGVYVYRVNWQDESETGKMTLVR